MQLKEVKCFCNYVLKKKWFKPVMIFLAIFGFLCSGSVFAVDELLGVLTPAKENFGLGSVFIKLLYGLEIIASGYAWHKTKDFKAVTGIVILSIFLNFALAKWVT